MSRPALRQVFDIDVAIAWFVVLEGFLGRRLLAFQHGDKLAQVRDAITAQATAQAGTRDGWVDDFADYRKQIVGRQQKRFA